MKNIILYVGAIFILLSCQKDVNTNNSNSVFPNDFNTILLSKSLEMFPIDKFRDNNQVVFKNAHGDQKVFNISIEKGIQQKRIGENVYDVEYMLVSLIDDTDESYSLSMQLSSNYYNETTSDYAEYITMSINQYTANGFRPFLHINVNSLARGNGSLFLFADYKEILGKLFSEVYYTEHELNNLGIDSYRKLYFNSKSGIIGYEGLHAEMWVLDSFVKK